MIRATSVLAVTLTAVSVGCVNDSEIVRGPLRPWDTVAVEWHMVSASTAAAVDDSVGWFLGAEPRIEMGFRTGGGDHLFGSVRGAVLLGDGQTVVADVQAGTLLYFDSDGQLETVAGGPGEGPGEFTLLFWVGRCDPDSVYAYDARLGRVSVFSIHGTYERSFPLVATGGVPVDAPRCSMGGVLAAKGFPTWADSPEAGSWVPKVPILVNATGKGADSVLAEFPYRRYIARRRGPLAAPLGEEAILGLSGQQLFLGFSDRYEFGVFQLDGTPVAVVGMDLPRRRVTPGDVEGFVREMAEGRPEALAHRLELWAKENMPDHFPLFDRLVVASTGDLWVRRYVSPLDEVHRWDVFEGRAPYRYTGSLTVPKSFEVFDVGDGQVVGRWVTELGEQRIREYGLRYAKRANGR